MGRSRTSAGDANAEIPGNNSPLRQRGSTSAPNVSQAQQAVTGAADLGRPGNGRGRPGSSNDPRSSPSNSYSPVHRTDQELQKDLDLTPRDGETPDNAADRAEAAEAELNFRRYVKIYERLGDDPPEFNIARNDDAHGGLAGPGHPHTNERHGPDVPLERAVGSGHRTIEGRIYGDPPWGGEATYSFRWDDSSVQNRAINAYVRENWDGIRVDLATIGKHEARFDFGNRVGDGYYNDGAYGAGPRHAHYHTTSHVKVLIKIVPGSDPPEPYIVSAFPNANFGG